MTHFDDPNEVGGSNTVGLVGFILSVIGFFTCVTAPIGLIVSLFGLPRKPSGLAVAGVIIGAFGTVGALVLASLVTTVVLPGIASANASAQDYSTRVTLQLVFVGIQDFRTVRGRSPETLTELIESSEIALTQISVSAEGQVLDAWGTPLDYQPRDDGSFTLRSFGSDTIPGTGDEITVDPLTGAAAFEWELESGMVP